MNSTKRHPKGDAFSIWGFWMRACALTLLGIACLASAPADAAGKGVKLNGDKKYGDCWGSQILGDFFERYPPPQNARFDLEIDINKSTREIFVYYRDVRQYEDLTAFYDSKACNYLRAENKHNGAARHDVIQ